MISGDSIHPSQGESPSVLLNYQRELRDRLLSKKKEAGESSLDESSPSSSKAKEAGTPFERLVETITKTDLSLQGKKNQIHYVKYALHQMDDEQAKAFEKNVKTLLRLQDQNRKRRFQSNGAFKPLGLELVSRLEKELKELQDVEEKIKKEKDQKKSILKGEVKEEPENADSIRENSNSLLKSIEEKQLDPFQSFKISYTEQSINQYVARLNEEFARITSLGSNENESQVDLVI